MQAWYTFAMTHRVIRDTSEHSPIRTQRHLLARLLDLRPPEYPVQLRTDLPIPMPDGITLYADHVAPQAAGPFPTILIRTPYGRPSETHLLGPLSTTGAKLFAERGYHVLVQSVRGRFRSEGHFEPFVHEARDGRATLDWIAAQPWFDGNLGMWGPSYMGYTQWAVAADAPPFLKALVPVTTTARFSHAFYPGGAFAYEGSLRWVSLIQASHNPGGNLNTTALRTMLSPIREANLRKQMASSPFAAADRDAIGAHSSFFQRLLSEATPEQPYWRQIDQHRGLSRVNAAVHLVAGWYDIFLAQQLADYTDLLAAKRTPCLTILPRHHSEPGLFVDAVREGLWWFDAHLKGQQELLQRQAVRLALMGSHEWHTMGYWPPPATHRRLFLQPGGLLSTTPPSSGSPSHYHYDPGNPTPSRGGPRFGLTGGPRDQRAIESRPDLLCFTTPPLEQDLDLIGYVQLELFAQANLETYDLVGRLCLVERNGHSRNICEGLLRVDTTTGEQQPDGSRRLLISLAATAQRFRTGQCIRLQICSAAHPRWSANSGDGRPLHEGAPVGPRLQMQILHDPNHPSLLTLPIVSAEIRRTMSG